MSPFLQAVAAAWPPSQWLDRTVLVAVSGGADSVALLRVLVELRKEAEGRLVVAHFNHGLRGSDSDADERFVGELAGELGLECRIGREDLAARARPDGIEAAAREARYAFLRATAEAVGARYVALAHTRDDQVETILHNILRGTGLAGVAGIPKFRGLGPVATLVRPLLELPRDDVIAYLAERGQPFRDDASNADRRFTRNRLRHELLPLLAEQYNPQVREALLRLGKLAAESQAVLASLVEPLLRAALISNDANGVRLSIDRLCQQPPHVVRELLVALWRERNWPRQKMGHEHWDELAQMILASGASGKRIFPGEVAAERRENELVLAPPPGQRREDS